MNRWSPSRIAIIIMLLTLTATATAQISPAAAATKPPAYSYETLAPSSAPFSQAFGISGDVVVGSYTDADTNNSYGYVRAANGTYTTIQHDTDPYTKIGDIDGSGHMIGWWGTASGPSGYFVRNGTTNSNINLTSNYAVLGINVVGPDVYVVGWFQDSSSYRGFTANIDVATGSVSNIAPFDYPGAAGTFPQRINTSGQIAGYYKDSSGNYHGFVRKADLTFTSIDFPAARTRGATVQTYVYGINNNSQVVGTYSDSSGNYHGFVGTIGGTYTTLDDPLAKGKGAGTHAYAINDAGKIVGYYDTHNNEYGFVATLKP